MCRVAVSLCPSLSQNGAAENIHPRSQWCLTVIVSWSLQLSWARNFTLTNSVPAGSLQKKKKINNFLIVFLQVVVTLGSAEHYE